MGTFEKTLFQALQEATRRGCDYIKSSAGAWNEKQQQRPPEDVARDWSPVFNTLARRLEREAGV